MARFYVYDKAKHQATSLTTYSYLNPRYLVVDRETAKPVDEATTAYAARLAAKGWNDGVYSKEDS